MKLLAMMALITTQVFAANKTICGRTDERAPSTTREIGRALDSRSGTGGCTVTMISKSCAVSAGHCMSVLKVIEFNTPASRGGNIQHPEAHDVYDVDAKSVKYKNNGPGDDWAVFKIKRNNVTGQFPGDVQGFYTISNKKPETGITVRITGYGLDRSEPTKNLAQQTDIGELTEAGGADDDWLGGRGESRILHTIDTMGGNSGSTIIREDTGEIIGIHTHGGCYSTGGANKGTLIATHTKFKAAIANCLASEK